MPLTNRDELLKLLQARHAAVAITTAEERYTLSVVREAAMQSRQGLFVWDCVNGLRDGLVKDGLGFDETREPGGALAWVERHARPDTIFCFVDLAEHLEKDPANRRLFRDVAYKLGDQGDTLILLGYDEPPGFTQDLVTQLDLAFPDEQELEDLVKETVRHHHRNVQPLRTDITGSDLRGIVANLRGLTRDQARQAVVDAIASDQKLDADDVDNVLKHKKRSLAAGGLLEFVEAPTDLDDLGGLSRLKKWLQLRRDADAQKARDFGIEAARGLLLLGVQGAGKSLASKAVATAWRRPLLRLDVGSLYDRFIGESEKRLRGALRQAEMMSPCILWIDEIEKAFAGAAAQSNDGGLSRRMFGSLLTWMQEHREPVFLIATANDVSALPPELLRKGRFDEIFFVDLPGEEARHRIFEIHLKRRKRKPDDFDLDRLVAASDGYSGAEIEQAIVSALYRAFDAGGDITTDTVERALQESPPLSVTRREQIQELRHWAQDRCVPAD
ncbi:MAG: AAA family ATPase [Planctomycetota bacterium]